MYIYIYIDVPSQQPCDGEPQLPFFHILSAGFPTTPRQCWALQTVWALTQAFWSGCYPDVRNPALDWHEALKVFKVSEVQWLFTFKIFLFWWDCLPMTVEKVIFHRFLFGGIASLYDCCRPCHCSTLLNSLIKLAFGDGLYHPCMAIASGIPPRCWFRRSSSGWCTWDCPGSLGDGANV